MKVQKFLLLAVIPVAMLLTACATTEIVESPKTTYVPESATPKTPEVIWTSRTLRRPFDYLGKIKSRSWTYDGALERLVDGAKTLRADAVIDVYYERIGFLKQMEAFAVKFKE